MRSQDVRMLTIAGRTADPSTMAPPRNMLQYFRHEEKKIFKKRKRLDGNMKKENVQAELMPPLVVAQAISIFPVSGVTSTNPNALRFRWRSFRMAYWIFVVSFNVILCILTLIANVRGHVNYRSIGVDLQVDYRDIVFYGGTICISALFLRLARSWKEVVKQWTDAQEIMADLKQISVRNWIKFITIFLTISSISEHLLANSETFLNYHEPGQSSFESFLRHRHWIVFSLVPYSHVVGVIIYLINAIITMIWNFNDIFLTCISLALGKMFKQFTLDLHATLKTVSQESSVSYWRKRREIYSRLSLLTKLVDQKLSVMVLFSFSLNLYYICVQLLHTIKPLKSLSHIIYFGGSFGHLLCRTCAVCFAASSIYENSKQPLTAIFSVPSDHFNIEIQRLQTQISSETLALTGMNFFTVTRTLMLTIAGTIVTYEIVLVQFNALGSTDESSQATTATTTTSATAIGLNSTSPMGFVTGRTMALMT